MATSEVSAERINAHRSYIGSNPEWSLLDGSIHYSYPICSFGGGHPFSCELIYDSNLPSITSDKFGGMPNCFMLSCHAKIIQSNNGYIFVDEEGTPHLFTSFIDQEDTYYHDNDGLGMILNDHNEITIDNRFGTVLHFDDKMRLSRKCSPSGFELSYVYDDKGRLTSVTDATGKKRKFVFEYDGALSYVKAYYGDKVVSITKLSYSTKHVLNVVVKWQLLSLDRISAEDNSKTEPLLNIKYKEQVFREEPPAIEFDDLYNHSAFQISYSGDKASKLSFSNIATGLSFAEKSFLEMTADDNAVTIKDQDGQQSLYMLDQKGYIVSTFEKDEEGKLFSLDRPKGNLLVLTNTETGIDNLPFRTCDRGFPVRITECIPQGSDKASPLSTLIIDKGCSLSVYVRLKESHPGAILSASGFVSAALNPYAVGVWQKVRLGFKDSKTPSELKISVTNDLGIAFKADICEPIIMNSGTERLIIDGTEFNEFNALTKNNERVRGVVSKTDLLTSLKHFVFSDCITYFLWMNNGHDIIQMDDVSFTLNDKEVLFTDFLETQELTLTKYDTQKGFMRSRKLKRSGNRQITDEKKILDASGNTIEHEIRIRGISNEVTIDSYGLSHRNQYTADGLPLRQYSSDDKIISENRYDIDGNLIYAKTDTSTCHYTYSTGSLSSITDGGVTKNIFYDGYGRTGGVYFADRSENRFGYFGSHLLSISDNSMVLGFVPNLLQDSEDYYINQSSIEHTEISKETRKKTYPNGSEITENYDSDGNLISVIGKGTDKATIVRDSDTSLPISIKDDFADMTTDIEYRGDKSIRKASTSKGGKVYLTKEEIHGKYEIEFLVGPGTLPYRRAISKKNALIRIVYDNSSHKLRVLGNDTYLDPLARPSKKESGPINCSYQYKNDSSLLQKLICGIFTEELEYANDSFRVTKAQFTGYINETHSFQYDSCGRLTVAARTGNDAYQHLYRYKGSRLDEIEGYLKIYHDSNGFISSVIDYLGEKKIQISYDNAGNMTKHGDKELSYQYGHRLSSVKEGQNESNYLYAYDGTRIEKSVNGTKTTFYYDGKTLLGEDRGDDVRIRYFQDTNSYTGFTLEEKGTDTYYLYLKDSFGNIIGIIDSQGHLVGTYIYDETGRLLSTVPNSNIKNAEHILNVNPLRYRGYYYDEETGFYYLHSRYYDPISMTFLTPDDKENIDKLSVSGADPYCYCGYDPINYYDPYGNINAFVAFILIGAAIGALSYTASSLISYAVTRKWSWSWCQFAGSIIGGAVGGFLASCSYNPKVIAFASSFVSTAMSMLLQDIFEGKQYSGADIIIYSSLSGSLSYCLSLLPEFKIYGLNAGRNSFMAITNSIAKKHTNNVIKNMSMKTMGKIFVYNQFSSTYGILSDAFFSIPNDKEEEEEELVS